MLMQDSLKAFDRAQALPAAQRARAAPDSFSERSTIFSRGRIGLSLLRCCYC